WALAAMYGLSGALWGTAGVLFFDPAEPLFVAFLAMLGAGMTAGGVSSASPFLPAYLMLALPCVRPFIAPAYRQWHVGGGGPTYLLLALLSTVFLLVNLTFARNTARTVQESILLRFEKLDLVEQLTTEKERAEAASVAKSRFLAAASHDLRQPLHALGRFIDALRAEPHAPRAGRIVDSIQESHRATTSLLENLLDFSKVDAGIVKPALASFPVQGVLDQVRADYALQANAADLEFRVRSCRVAVRSDPVLLARMLGNLISNAIRYTETGRVLVGCRRRAGHLRIEVHDTGIGIPEGQHQAVFREFYQVEDGARPQRKGVGMGLGLAIVSGLAKALEHPVPLSSAPGKGSVFAVRVPLADPQTAVAAAPAPVMSDSLRDRTILVIDDEPAIRDAVAEVLLRWGCHPLTAGSAEAAAAAFAARGERPDAMVVDYQLEHGEAGVEAIARLAVIFGTSLPAIIVPGATRRERRRGVREIGSRRLYKPLAPMRLRAALTAALQAAPRGGAAPVPGPRRADPSPPT